MKKVITLALVAVATTLGYSQQVKFEQRQVLTHLILELLKLMQQWLVKIE